MAEPALNGKAESTPELVSAESEVEYLRQAALAGGKAYKAVSYDLLDLQPGMRVLDVGCGLGEDLPALADRVGPHGMVIGIEPDWECLQSAHQAAAGRGNIVVARGAAENLGLDEGSFDRVRADWVLQDIPHPQQALAGMWRVLGPGGMLELIEPDWKALLLFPASPVGGDDDHALQILLHWYQRQMPHALMGRQLLGLVQQQNRLERVEVQMLSLDWTSWRLADAVMRITAAARALVKAEPVWTAEIAAWLQAVEAAAKHEEFLASLPLVIVRAWKERYVPLSGRPSQGGTTSPFAQSTGGA
jgi:ubiquinone/menaquinone biosynthesis C-methylase UbiE